MPRSGIAGSYGDFSLSLLSNLHAIFHSGCINLYSHQQYKRVPLFFSITSPPFIVCKLFDGGHSDHPVKAMVFPVVMHGCERWIIRKTEH